MRTEIVLVEIDWTRPCDTSDAYWAAPPQSSLVRPRSINLDGIFGRCPTSCGPRRPCAIEDSNGPVSVCFSGRTLTIYGVDSFRHGRLRGSTGYASPTLIESVGRYLARRQ